MLSAILSNLWAVVVIFVLLIAIALAIVYVEDSERWLLATFLIWSCFINVIMGSSYLFLGGAESFIGFFAKLWTDYGEADVRFSLRDNNMFTLQILNLFLFVPLSACLILCVVEARNCFTKKLIQATFAGGMLVSVTLQFLPELLSGMVHLNPDWFLYSITIFYNVFHLFMSIYMLVTVDGESGGRRECK